MAAVQLGVVIHNVLSSIASALVSLASLIWYGLHALETKWDSAPAGLRGSIVAAAITGTIAFIAFRTNAAVNLRNKRMDVIQHCNSRYDELQRLRNDIEREPDDDRRDHLIASYFRRYWGLQSDQLDYWFAGCVDPETLASWVASLTASLSGKNVGHGAWKQSYAASWDTYGLETHQIVNERLAETVSFSTNYLTRIDDAPSQYGVILQYLRIIEQSERSLIRRLSSDDHRRMSVGSLAKTLPSDQWKTFNAADTRFWYSKWAYRFAAFFPRRAHALRIWARGNRRDRLEKIIDLHWPAPKKDDHHAASADVITDLVSSVPPRSVNIRDISKV